MQEKMKLVTDLQVLEDSFFIELSAVICFMRVPEPRKGKVRWYRTPVAAACQAFFDVKAVIVRILTHSSKFFYNRTTIHFMLQLLRFWAWQVRDWITICIYRP